MNSLIFRTATSLLFPYMLALSVIILLRGHNEPGGGFVGGLVAASGFALYSLAMDVGEARRRLRVHPIAIIGIGLTIAALSGLPAMFTGDPFLTGHWIEAPIPGFPAPLKIGTPVVFDIGVYLLVLGVVLTMIFSLEDSLNATTTGR